LSPPPAPALPLPPKAPQSEAAKKLDEELSKSLLGDSSKAPAKLEPAAPAKPESKADTGSKPTLRILFKTTETSLPLSYKTDLDAMAKRLKANDKERVNILAYASSVGDQPSTARRVSLSRALSVRASLIDAGVGSMRINVQAEGDKNPGGEPDRVDLVVQGADAK
jgi:outer membrane protein OmpA-like peptidoglycan-associated protein